MSSKGSAGRAPHRECSRAGGRCRAEQITARAADAFEDALRSVHANRSADALRVVWHECAGGVAERVVGPMAPATNLGLVVLSKSFAASLASWAAAKLIS